MEVVTVDEFWHASLALPRGNTSSVFDSIVTIRLSLLGTELPCSPLFKG